MYLQWTMLSSVVPILHMRQVSVLVVLLTLHGRVGRVTSDLGEAIIQELDQQAAILVQREQRLPALDRRDERRTVAVCEEVVTEMEVEGAVEGLRVLTATCSRPGLAEEEEHWCLQDYSSLPGTLLLPSGCSAWVRENDWTEVDERSRRGLVRLGEVQEVRRRVGGGEEVVSRECVSLGLGSGGLHGADYWCEQAYLHLPSLPHRLPSGCTCFVPGHPTSGRHRRHHHHHQPQHHQQPQPQPGHLRSPRDPRHRQSDLLHNQGQQFLSSFDQFVYIICALLVFSTVLLIIWLIAII